MLFKYFLSVALVAQWSEMYFPFTKTFKRMLRSVSHPQCHAHIILSLPHRLKIKTHTKNITFKLTVLIKSKNLALVKVYVPNF